MFVKIRTTSTVLLLLLNCKCLGLSQEGDHPNEEDHPNTEETTPGNINQRQPAQPSAPPYKATQRTLVYPDLPHEAEEKTSVGPTDLPPSYDEVTAPPSYEDTTAPPPRYEQVVASSFHQEPRK